MKGQHDHQRLPRMRPTGHHRAWSKLSSFTPRCACVVASSPPVLASDLASLADLPASACAVTAILPAQGLAERRVHTDGRDCDQRHDDDVFGHSLTALLVVRVHGLSSLK